MITPTTDARAATEARADFDRGVVLQAADRWREAGAAFAAATHRLAGTTVAHPLERRRLLCAGWCGLAETLTLRGEAHAALRVLWYAHREARRLLPTDAAELGRILNHRAVVWKSLGRHGLARALYAKALAILDRQPNASLTDRATLYHNLGGIEFACGQLQTAESFTRTALALRYGAAEVDAAAVASDAAALGAILRARGALQEAEARYRQALAAFATVLGPGNHEVALCQEGLALVLSARGDHAGARGLLAEAVASRTPHLPPDHPDLGILLANLGVMSAKCGDTTSARRQLRAGEQILRRKLGPDHEFTRACLAALAKLAA